MFPYIYVVLQSDASKESEAERCVEGSFIQRPDLTRLPVGLFGLL